MAQTRMEILAKKALEEAARREYLSYCMLTNGPKYIVGKHIQYVADRLDDFFDGEDKYLLVDMPPQHGKSMSITETLGAYRADRYAERVLLLSYGDVLAGRFGRQNRRKLSDFKIFGNHITKANDTDIELSNGGTIKSRGIMAGVSGEPADLIIIDDPIKNRQEADSESFRERLWEEFLAVANTRLSANGKVIVIQTRWHEDDLIGRLKGFDHVVQIHIPLEAEEDDILGRAIGDPLFPEIGKDKKWLNEFKKMYIGEKGLRTWNALMQGRPSSAEGNILKRAHWRMFTVTPKVIRTMPIITMSIDATFKDKKTSDFVALGIWGKSRANYYLLDGIKRRMGFVDTIAMIRTFLAKYPMIRYKYIEDKANGSAIIDVLNRQIGGFIPVQPNGDKVARAEAIAPYQMSGNVFICDDSFGYEVIDECASFPHGKNDDLVDMTTQAISNMLHLNADFERDEVYDPLYPTQEQYDKENLGLFSAEPINFTW